MDSLLARYRGLVCDLDGVVYRGARAVDHAVDALNAARARGVGAVYATNNASRTPRDVGDQLRDLGIKVDDAHVLTSSLAGARHLADQIPAGARVLAVGGAGVDAALEACGLSPARPEHASSTTDAVAEAVLQGYGPQVTAASLASAAYAIQGGALWVATNTDLTLPTEFGIAPGNGSLVGAVRNAVDVDPVVVGKPGPMMYQMAADILGTSPEETLGVGDRLETDIEGAHAAGMDAVLVLTGVHGPSEAAAADAKRRPRFIVRDLRALAEPYAEPQLVGDDWVCGAARARCRDGQLQVAQHATEPVETVRAALTAIWAATDAGVISAAAAPELLRRAKLDNTAIRSGEGQED